jgi:hypothetical protein
VPQGYRKRPAGKVPHNGIGERGDAECNACRYASSAPMTTKLGDGRAAPSAERGRPVDLPWHSAKIAAIGLRISCRLLEERPAMSGRLEDAWQGLVSSPAGMLLQRLFYASLQGFAGSLAA